MRNSRYEIHKNKKQQMKDQIKASVFSNIGSNDKISEYKKQLENLKQSRNSSKSPQTKGNTSSKKLFFDENYKIKDIDKFNLDNNIADYKFTDPQDVKVENLDDLIKCARQISKDDFSTVNFNKKNL